MLSRTDGRNFRRIVDEGFSLDFDHILSKFLAEDVPPGKLIMMTSFLSFCVNTQYIYICPFTGWIRLARDCCSIDPTARPLTKQLLARLEEIDANLPRKMKLSIPLILFALNL